jgi:hypothetical protein
MLDYVEASTNKRSKGKCIKVLEGLLGEDW